jgi:hypothetical protein
MQAPRFSAGNARQIDLVDYLESLGHHAQKIRGNDYWYLSPLRSERTASFKVNRKLNLWYDHGLGKGGSIIDFGMRYFNCSVKDFLEHLQNHLGSIATSFFHQPFQPQKELISNKNSAGEKKQNEEHKIVVLDTRTLQNKSLLQYLEKRCIGVDIASQFCREVDFQLYGKTRTTIGFENNAGGYELRSPDFKGSSAPKASSFFDHGKEAVSVFEGFFDFLSYQTMHQDKTGPLTNFLVLNSLAFFEKEKQRMEVHERVELYLDRDKAGIRCAQ